MGDEIEKNLGLTWSMNMVHIYWGCARILNALASVANLVLAGLATFTFEKPQIDLIIVYLFDIQTPFFKFACLW